jgi:hypothetical protein
MNTELENHRIRAGFEKLVAFLRAPQDEAEDARKRAEVAALSIARNDERITQEWLAFGLEPFRSSNGRPISLALARSMGLVRIVSHETEAAE